MVRTVRDYGRVKRRIKRAAPVRRTTRVRRPIRRAMRPKRFTKRKVNARGKRGGKKGTSRSSAFAKRVLQVVSAPGRYTYQETFRATWPTGVQHCGLQDSSLQIYIYDVDTMMNAIWPLTQAVRPQTTILPVGNQGGIDDGKQGDPLDFYIKSGRCDIRLTNQCSALVDGTMWLLKSRYDQEDNVAEAYTGALAQQGSVGPNYTIIGGESWTADDVGATPFDFRALCQRYKIFRKAQFKMQAGETKRFLHQKNQLLHVTERMSGLDILRQTECIFFTFSGNTMNDFYNKSLIGTASGAVDVSFTVSHEYVVQPGQYYLNDLFPVNTSALNTPSYIMPYVPFGIQGNATASFVNSPQLLY